jgi:hypothetical protein
MKDALLSLHTDGDAGGDYQRNSIIYCYEDVAGFAEKMYSKWLQVKAYGLALEDDGWNLDYIEDSFSYEEV